MSTSIETDALTTRPRAGWAKFVVSQ